MYFSKTWRHWHMSSIRVWTCKRGLVEGEGTTHSRKHCLIFKSYPCTENKLAKYLGVVHSGPRAIVWFLNARAASSYEMMEHVFAEHLILMFTSCFPGDWGRPRLAENDRKVWRKSRPNINPLQSTTVLVDNWLCRQTAENLSALILGEVWATFSNMLKSLTWNFVLQSTGDGYKAKWAMFFSFWSFILLRSSATLLFSDCLTKCCCTLLPYCHCCLL